MYNVLDISKYIINKSIEINKPVGNLKLQKLLYYVQANFLVKANKPCFSEDIVHWRHGGVVVESYQKYRKYFNDDIITIQPLDKTIFESEDLFLIDEVIYKYLNVSAWEMVSLHQKEEAWLNTKRNEIISNESIKESMSKQTKKNKKNRLNIKKL